MMRLLTLLLTVFLFAQLASCKSDADVKPTQTKLIDRTWLRSHEEEPANSSVQIYRPEGYAFPPSWPRTGFLFYADGRLVTYSPAANDGGSIPTEVGTWTWEQDAIIHTQFSAQYGSGKYRLRVIELTRDVLKVQQLQ
ncbi:hypothetical protein [Hymenobacter sp. GOD-10R]|uniref:hypothetical protein n=1 Tax=Hymenobacter sp. GOD-10R TaxID=3093922 RepID=UPI002D79509E|nr:hypothetical protein [Hymenobacter sp. GOD-10R]WRQ29660.1 hypothetical protein SD425_05215 [Hymenobacter sp. GOD-10R]